MGVELYSHQIEAIGKMKNGCILQGGVGSGKSRTALAYYYTKVCDGKLDILNGTNQLPKHTKPLYVITTARKRDTLDWEYECRPFLLSTNRDISILQIEVHVDSWNNVKKYVGVSNAFFIFDEQRVVGYGKWTQSFLKIAKNNQWILLSATPGDCWTDYIPVFIANGYYQRKSDFVRQHVVYSRFSKYPKIDRYVDTKILMKHRDDILVKMDFDRETVQHHDILVADYDRTLYKGIMKNRWDPWKDEPIQDISGLCYLLRRAANDNESRRRLVLDIFNEHSKAIVFYNFNYELDALRELADSNYIFYAEWNGHKHEPVPTEDCWLYFVQYTAGAEGWNCIQTDTIIFYSQSYSYKTMQQASGRIDRLNTPYKDLYYYHIRSSAPIDLAIKRALDNKKDFNESRFIKH